MSECGRSNKQIRWNDKDASEGGDIVECTIYLFLAMSDTCKRRYHHHVKAQHEHSQECYQICTVNCNDKIRYERLKRKETTTEHNNKQEGVNIVDVISWCCRLNTDRYQ